MHHGVGDGGGFNGDVFGLVQQAGGQRLHRVGEGGREQQILAARRQQRQHAAQLVGKTQVKQAVGFVQHQHGHMRQPQRVVVYQVQQATRGGDHDVGTTTQRHHLGVDRNTPKHHGGFHRHTDVLRQAADGFTNLGGQLAGGGQHQRTHTARRLGRCGGQQLQQGQHKSRRFARAGLGRAQHVCAAQDHGNRRSLDRRGGGVTLAGGGADKGRGQAQLGKWHGKRGLRELVGDQGLRAQGAHGMRREYRVHPVCRFFESPNCYGPANFPHF